MTDLYKKILEKIHKLERLTPSWDWQFEIEKNCFNSRTSKHKYKSGDKSSDLPKRVTTDRISRYFNNCLTDVLKIENLDSDFVVTLRAIKPEGESNRKKNIHQYQTPAESESGPESSQESAANSGSSQEALGSQNVEDDGFTLSCRICRDDIYLQDVATYVACLKPAGKAHFAAHFSCLGLFPSTKSERMDIRHMYRCPAHG